MEAGDMYKSLLATASHAQQQRHARLQTSDKGHAVGNVFLPAIQKRSSVQSALSMKHLQVIEQCILAENRREEQLAKCQSDKERRYLTKKFIAQRHHERDLIQALMIGQPSEAELLVEDVATETYESPLLAGSRGPVSQKSTSSASPDKVIKMAGERTFATTSPSKRQPMKAVSPHFHGTASPERRRLADQEGWRSEQSLPSSPSKNLGSSATAVSPKRVRPARSASPTHKPTPSPPASPTRQRPNAAPTDHSKLPYALANSPLKAKAISPSPVSSPSKVRKVKPHPKASTEAPQDDSVDETIEFEGASSFLEARKHVMALVHDKQGLVEGETQTTGRFDSVSPANDHSRQTYVLMLTKEDELPVHDGPRRRPHSSPEPWRRRPSADSPLLPALATSHSDTSLRNVEFFRASEASTSTSGSVATYVSDDRTKTIHMYPKETRPEMVDQQLAWTDPPVESTSTGDDAAQKASVEEAGGGLARNESTDEIDWDELERRVREDMQMQPIAVAVEATEEEQSFKADEVAEPEDSSNTVEGDAEYAAEDQGSREGVEEDEKETHSLLLSTIYDIVHEIEDTHAQEQLSFAASLPITSSAEAEEPGPETRRISLKNFALFVTRIQSSFRGYRARKAFRLALYQEALQCGVLGAMPGTTQGHSGWYQDPKSFMAYYFVVEDDGEWTQKSVLRCTGLVLTPYQMHAQILTRVQVPCD